MIDVTEVTILDDYCNLTMCIHALTDWSDGQSFLVVVGVEDPDSIIQVLVNFSTTKVAIVLFGNFLCHQFLSIGKEY